VRKYDLAANGADLDGGRVYAPHNLVVSLAGIASLLVERKRDQAAAIWGAVCAAEEALGFRILAAERRRYESRLARLEGTPAWTAGRRLTLEDAVASIPVGIAP
jgi:hypothetical protein